MTPVPPEREPAVAETHSSVVVFAGELAVKWKKAVRFDFLDFTTPEARRAACEREVELNRRLAPDVYLGVGCLTDSDGAVLDTSVLMRRLPPERRLSRLIDEDEDAVVSALDDLARQLAELHARSPRSAEIDGTATKEALLARWRDDLAELAEHAAGRVGIAPGRLDYVATLAEHYLRGRHDLLESRIADGRIVDGHGDLLADDVFVLDDGPRAIDCLEFDDRLRWGDGLADAAFLAMDLDRLGHPRLAKRFIASYRAAADDDWPPGLAQLYIAQRALVRAKVAAARRAQGHEASGAESARRLDQAVHHLEQAQVRLVLVGGIPGSGKTTLATHLADALEADQLSSDVIRKDLAGIDLDARPEAALDEGLYAPAKRQETYAELLKRASASLRYGQAVVADATWLEEHERKQAASVAVDCDAELIELRCVAPPAVASERTRGRRAGPSDATPAVALALAERADPWPAAYEVPTGGAPDAALQIALDAIHARAPSR